MRLIATGLVAAAALLAFAAAWFQPTHPSLAWVRAGAEAALVGGLADWFAVVALFHRPLGLPIPHTAIVPRNKDRIGTELGLFVERNFLTPAIILQRLEGIDFASHAARWVGRRDNAVALAGLVRSVLPRLLDALDDTGIDAVVTRVAHDRLDRLDAAMLTARSIRFLGADGRLQPLLDASLDMLAGWLDRNRVALRDRYSARSRWMPRWADTMIINKFVDAVIDLLEEVAATPRHELRQSFDDLVTHVADRLEQDEAWRAEAEKLKQDLIEQIGIERLVQSLWQELKRRVAGAGDGPVEARLAVSIERLAAEFPSEGDLPDRLNQAALALIAGILGQFHEQVSTLIGDIVRRWDGREVARRLEREVGSDLQYIRINGTLVGAAVGIAIHAIAVAAAL